MNELALLALLVLNFGISCWNAYAAGSYFTESKIIGGMTRFMVWCGLTMAACGFTWVYVTLLAMIAVAGQWLTPEWAEVMFKLGYLIIILPVLGSGLGIWVNSLVAAYRQRTLGNIGIAAWNTYAQAHNTWEAARHAPNFLKDVLDAFSSKNRSSNGKDSAAGILVILLVILAVAGGAITTGLIARWADRRVALEVSPA
ncbi:MAG: hypothetical protein A2408_02045 [Candidatus Yonathbacteria bacterium RIFOXYC1_FULL_52_10]|uniref:Uncharacterized protein n=1 Tax=Candidatus Yonathbacteria bacterium RIFOXYD1_FULL_52_36 TaxID=1802730 RepID=A0A1G2SJ20_9BACT|nr:MAG: hypothetical protein A2408_02045 [Candidatus Yonathbacteria bacterium RIFOXYC1_FULL_52_10]OHA84964.1 MAG: hypothetical protein A2591_03675 [Candidatus Yonathbacteria bacterium RIFOXYD1_FULL_52_36]